MSTIDNLKGKHTVVAITYEDAWLKHNRGLLSQVARQLGISRQAVTKVWRGEGHSVRIEKALRRRRVPGFEARRRVA
jgi:hypothetical protein